MRGALNSSLFKAFGFKAFGLSIGGGARARTLITLWHFKEEEVASKVNKEDNIDSPLYADSPPWYSKLTTWAVVVLIPIFGMFRGGRSNASQEFVQTVIFLLLAAISVSLIRGGRESFLERMQLPGVRVVMYCGASFLLLLLLQIVPLPYFLLNIISVQSSALYQHAPTSFGHISIDLSQTIQQMFWFLALLVLSVWFLQLPRSVFRSANFHQRSSQSKKRIRVVVLELDYVCFFLSRSLVWAGVVFAIFSLLHQILSIESLFGMSTIQGAGRRAHVPFANPNHLAVFIEASLFFALSIFLFTLEESNPQQSSEPLPIVKKIWQKLLMWKYGFAALFLFVTLVATVSRVGIVLVFMGLGAFFVLVLHERRDSILPRSMSVQRSGKRAVFTEARVIALMKLGIVLVFVVAALIAFLGDSGSEVVADRFGAGVTEGIDVIRRELFSISLSAVPTYFLFGAGLGCWHFAVSPFTTEKLAGINLDYAHNDLLQLLVETGVFGFSIALVVIGVVIRFFVGAWRRSVLYVERVHLLGALLAVGLPLLHSLIDFPFHIPVLALSWVIALVILLRRIEGCA